MKRLLGPTEKPMSSCRLLGISKKKCTKARKKVSKLKTKLKKSRKAKVSKALARRRAIRKARAKLR